MIAAPPPLQTVRRTPVALSILTGLAGLAVAAGASSSGFLFRLAQSGRITFYWGDATRMVAIVALVGAVLALMQHDAGPPLVAGASIVFAVLVVTTVTIDRFEMSNFVDEFTWRALAFLGGGAAAAVATVLGLASLRGRGRPGCGAATLALGLGVLGCHAAFVGLDERRDDVTLRPFLGIALVIGVMVLGAFVGRAGALVAAAGAACLFPVYIEWSEFGFDRQPFGILATAGLAAIIAVTVATTVAIARRPVVQYFGHTEAPWTGYSPEPTQVLPVQPTATAPWAGEFVPTQQIPAIGEPRATGGVFDEPRTVPMDMMPTGVMSIQPPSQPTDSSPAQWMSDPYGRHQLRYWDGRTWTEHVSNAGVTERDPV